ncbi:hypothetical protein I7G59_21225 [Sinorhizobium meliloti]|uniref:hypothetical protein n=1 Tax=Rhizobium meliloti TaxID=382 RepID=UPI000FD8AE7E|nr:hypothetical protein [Sinorhizobium meliloti]MDE3799823.1 hypothetical protein [Sinorhizobium meliloti]RVH57664.1 hypothetical protein CN213_11895 [Sinorhizobium meliloti]
MAVALAGQPVEPHGAKFRLIHYAIYLAQNVKILATSRARARDARLPSTKNEAARATVALVVTVQQ